VKVIVRVFVRWPRGLCGRLNIDIEALKYTRGTFYVISRIRGGRFVVSCRVVSCRVGSSLIDGSLHYSFRALL